MTEVAPVVQRSRTPVLGIVAVVAVLVGIVLMFWGFVAGIDAAFSGDGGSGIYIGIFVFGGILVTAGGVLALVRLILGRTRILSVVTIVLALVPIAGIIALRLANG